MAVQFNGDDQRPSQFFSLVQHQRKHHKLASTHALGGLSRTATHHWNYSTFLILINTPWRRYFILPYSHRPQITKCRHSMPPQQAFTRVLQGQGSTVYSSQAHSLFSTAVILAQRASHIHPTLIISILISTVLLLKGGRLLNLHTQMDHYSNITLEGLTINFYQYVPWKTSKHSFSN